MTMKWMINRWKISLVMVPMLKSSRKFVNVAERTKFYATAKTVTVCRLRP